MICASFFGGGAMKQRTVSDEDLAKAYKIMAKVIRDHGDKYLPVFQRLHEEMETRKSKQGLKDIALQIAFE